jgi:hypothetical protein
MSFTIPNLADAGFADQAEPDAQDFRIVTDASGLTGVVSGCAVTAQGTPDMTVAVASGVILSSGTQQTVTSGNVTIAAADGTNPRFDLVVADSSGAKQRRAGTAAANPVFPTPTAGDVVLAAVYVPAADTAINTNQIVDKRVTVINHLTQTNTWTGANTFSHASGVTTDVITERTGAAGVTADGVLLKDGNVTAPGGVVSALGAVIAGDGAGNIYLQHTSGNNGMLTIENAAAGCKLTFYSEAASGDVVLRRTASGRLTTDGSFQAANKIYPGTDAAALQTACGLYAGTGAPNNANGANGDFYLRSDGSASSSLYHKEGGSWVARA